MKVIRLPLVLVSALMAVTVAGCSSYTERTVYVPRSTAYVPAPAPAPVYYDSYHPAYYSY